jgi:hypothetical protein
LTIEVLSQIATSDGLRIPNYFGWRASDNYPPTVLRWSRPNIGDMIGGRQQM